MPDAVFSHPRLAAVYDDLDPDRSDLDVYVALAAELGATRVLDVGCGTGTFALLLADAGHEVVGVDPAAASLGVARAKPGADRVRWIDGDATTPTGLQVDLVTMTANVAQVFVDDADWAATLRGVHAALRPGGHLVFETRVPERRAWEEWTPERTRTRVDCPGAGVVETWLEVVEVTSGNGDGDGDGDGDRVTFVDTNVFESDGEQVVSRSTLRFRTRAELDDSLEQAGFEVREVRDAPDRPGREWVYVAVRPTGRP